MPTRLVRRLLMGAEAPVARIPIPSVFGAMIAIAALYFAKPVLAPLAVALLLSIVFEPAVRRLEPLGRGRWRVGRVGSVLLVAISISGALASLGFVVAHQAGEIGEELPEYSAKIRSMIEEPVARIERALSRVNDITASEREPGTRVVEVAPSESQLARLLGSWSGSLLSTLANAGIVIVLVVFLLIERDELRDRLLRVAGRGDLRLTSSTVREATERVTRYLRSLALLNCGHGIAVGVGLTLLGVPAAPLFGLIAAVLRFVPYVGPWIAALAPIALTLAVSGWTSALYVALFLITLELVSNNFFEPWLYGASVGLSPFAVILSAIFWAWLWGPIGLVLATPLTVCLVVIGRHVPQLENLSILLGDSHALRPFERLYERIGAHDLDAAAEVFTAKASAGGALAAWDEVAVPALRLLERDRQRELLSEEDLAAAREVFGLLVDELPDGERSAVDVPTRPIICMPAAVCADEILAAALAQELVGRGLAARATARLLTAELVGEVAHERSPLVCISALDARGMPVRHLLKRLQRRSPEALLVIGCWGEARERLPMLREQWGAELQLELVTTLADAADLLAGRARLEREGTRSFAAR